MYEYEVYETIREVEAELELESMTGPQFPSIPGGGETIPQDPDRLKSVGPTGRPTVEERARQLKDAAQDAFKNRKDETARLRFCAWYRQFTGEYPELVEAFNNVAPILCPPKPKKRPKR